MTDLSAFLGQAASRPVVWGTWDCHLWLADWVMVRRGVDPAATLRGRYRTPLGALRLLNREGGSAALVSRMAEQAGLPSVAPADAVAGDVGLLQCAGGRGVELLGCVCTGPRWAVLAFPSGIAAGPALPVLAWRP